MDHSKETRTVSQKIKLFRSLFSGLLHVYGTYNPQTGKVRQIKQAVTDRVIHQHLIGRQPYGVYLLQKNRTQALAVDFDREDISPPVKFVHAAYRYGLPGYIERSKSKGYHVWLFFEPQGVLAQKPRRIAQHLLKIIGAEKTEIFPKQDQLNTSVVFGNFINAPLFGKLAAQVHCVFLDLETYATPYADQWQFLAGIKRISEKKLDQVLSSLPLETSPVNEKISSPDKPVRIRSVLGLPPCARRILAEGVSHYQRVACFRMAVSLKRVGMPFDLTLIALKTWAEKNCPANGKSIITQKKKLNPRQVMLTIKTIAATAVKILQLYPIVIMSV